MVLLVRVMGLRVPSNITLEWNGTPWRQIGQKVPRLARMVVRDILWSNITLEYGLFVQRISGMRAFPATLKSKANLKAKQVRLVNRGRTFSRVMLDSILFQSYVGRHTTKSPNLFP